MSSRAGGFASQERSREMISVNFVQQKNKNTRNHETRPGHCIQSVIRRARSDLHCSEQPHLCRHPQVLLVMRCSLGRRVYHWGPESRAAFHPWERRRVQWGILWRKQQGIRGEKPNTTGHRYVLAQLIIKPYLRTGRHAFGACTNRTACASRVHRVGVHHRDSAVTCSHLAPTLSR